MVTHVAGDHVGQAFDILRRSQAKLVCDMATRFVALASGIAPMLSHPRMGNAKWPVSDGEGQSVRRFVLHLSEEGTRRYRTPFGR